MGANAAESPIRELYRHLSSTKPFNRALFSSAIGSDQFYFHRTSDVQRVVSLFESFRQSDAPVNGKRMLGVYSNIGDGKTTLLGFLRYLTVESAVLPIFVNGLGNEGDDPSRALITLAWYLLYELKRRNLLEEKLYNAAKLKFGRPPDSEADRNQLIQDQISIAKQAISGKYLVWLCDNVAHRSCLRAFQQLLDLRDPEPPTPHFFAETPVLIVFSTSEIDLIKAWGEDPNRSATGHKLESLGVRAEDMFQIVRQVLDASSQDLPAELRPRVAAERQINPVYPIDEAHLRLFLRNKARKESLEQPRSEVKLQVAEIQLRNTLRLLQRLIDARATNDCDRPIDLQVLLEADLGG